ncbi:MAG: hypothetical protein WCE94_02960 [Candidatus Methanoperedens sp.]
MLLCNSRVRSAVCPGAEGNTQVLIKNRRVYAASASLRSTSAAAGYCRAVLSMERLALASLDLGAGC